MASSKAPPMPVVPPTDDEIERHDAYVRLNPKGHKELVVQRQGKPDEETLNELSLSILDLLEDVEFTNPPTLSAEQPNFSQTLSRVNQRQQTVTCDEPAIDADPAPSVTITAESTMAFCVSQLITDHPDVILD